MGLVVLLAPLLVEGIKEVGGKGEEVVGEVVEGGEDDDKEE